jgi:hypothetical protein
MASAHDAGRIEPNCYPVRFSQKHGPPIKYRRDARVAGIIYR